MKCNFARNGCTFSNSKREVISSHQERCHYRSKSPTRSKSPIRPRSVVTKIHNKPKNPAEEMALLNRHKQSLLESYTTKKNNNRKRPAPEALSSCPSHKSNRTCPIEPDVVIIHRPDNTVLYHGYKQPLSRARTRDAQTQTPAEIPSPAQPTKPPPTSTPKPCSSRLLQDIKSMAHTHPGLQSFLDDITSHARAEIRAKNREDPLLPSPSPSTDPLRLESSMPNLELNMSFESECRNPQALATICDH